MNLPHIPALNSLTGYAGLTAVIAIVISTWGNIVRFFHTVSSFFILKVVLKDEAALAMTSYVIAKGKRSKLGLRLFGGGKVYINPLQRVEVVGFESFSSDPCLIWLGRVPFIFSLNSHNDNMNYGDYSDAPVNLTTIRGLFNVQQIILNAIEHYNGLHRSNISEDECGRICVATRRFQVIRMGRLSSFGNQQDEKSSAMAPPRATRANSNHEVSIRTKTVRLLRWEITDIGQTHGQNSAFNVFFYPESIMKFVEEVRTWIKREKWFKTKGIPWRLGWLLHGKPGTGKSTLVRSMGMEFDVPVYVLDLSCLDNESLTNAWQQIQQNSPAIALIEDIDSVFKGRENITAKAIGDSLTFDCLLNTISGVNNSDGVFLIITTNDISSLDSAIGIPDKIDGDSYKSTRPGRIDRIIELEPMGYAERIKVAKYILTDYPEVVDDIVKEGEKESAAQFQNRCTQYALARFWDEQKQKLGTK